MRIIALTTFFLINIAIGNSQNRTVDFAEIIVNPVNSTNPAEILEQKSIGTNEFTITFIKVEDKTVFEQCKFFTNAKEKELKNSLNGKYDPDEKKYTITLTTLISNLEETSAFSIKKDTNTIYYFEIMVSPDDGSSTPPKSSSANLTSIIRIPLPIFNEYPKDSILEVSKKNRFLIIDARPNPYKKGNNTLYKKRKNKLKKSSGIPVNSSLAVLIKNYSFINIEETSININGTDYAYKEGLSDVYKQLEPATGTTGVTPENSPKDSLGITPESSPGTSNLYDYLNTISSKLDSTNYMNMNDFQYLQFYQDTLQIATSKMNSLSLQEESIISKIRSWRPEYVSLTPIALTVPDADEVDMTVSLKYKGNTNAKEYNVGTYRTSGGLAVGINSNIYLTGLKNRDVYTDSILVGGKNELRAILDSNDELSIGIGMNSELSFRTGCMLKPTVNVGFFIPIGEEDLSPFLALGPGFSIGTKKVKFSLSGGWAFGKINTISTRYKDKDLTQYSDLTKEKLSEKVWKSSWQVGIGLSYNLTNKQD